MLRGGGLQKVYIIKTEQVHIKFKAPPGTTTHERMESGLMCKNTPTKSTEKKEGRKGQMKDKKQGIKELTVSSAEHVAKRLSSKGEKSISVTRSDREEGNKWKVKKKNQSGSQLNLTSVFKEATASLWVGGVAFYRGSIMRERHVLTNG